MTHIRKHTSAIHRRNIRRAKVKAYAAAVNPTNAFIFNQVFDILF